MVSEKVITPATWTETARNLATNPSFEAASGTVEIRRNKVWNPAGRAGGTGIALTDLSATLGATVNGREGITFTKTGSNGVSYDSTGAAATVGKFYAARLSVTAASESAVGQTVRFLVHNGAPLTLETAPVILPPVGTYIDVDLPAAAAAASTGMLRVFHYARAQETLTIGGMFHVSERVITEVPAAGMIVPAGFFDGATSPDIDLTPSWDGPVNASESILTGVRMAGVTAFGADVIRSTRWKKGGAYSARIIPNSTSTNSGFSIGGGSLPKRATHIITTYLEAPIVAPSTTAGLVSRYSPTIGDQRPNTIGEYEHRFSTPETLTGGTLDIRIGCRQGDGEMWVDHLAIIEGEYAGPYIDGSMYSTDRKRYSWLGESDASISIEEVMTAPAVTEPVFEVVTLTTTNDEIVFHGDPASTGFVYDNETLQRWYNPAPIEVDVDKRPNAHGAYGLGQLFTEEHRPLITGQYYGASSADAKRARQRLVSSFSEGHPVSIAVTDEEGVTTRRAAWLIDYDAPFTTDFSHFTFDLTFVAPDPRRYGATESMSIGLPSPGSGLVWNLGTAPSGLYFDWGTAGSLGQITVTNSGGAATNPRIEVGGAGGFLDGFRVTEIETGRELTLERSTETGDVIVLDSRTQRATLNGGDISRFLTSRDWFEIPAAATRRYQINPLGATSGAPTMTIYTASASL